MADVSDELYDLCSETAKKSDEGYRKIFKQDDLITLCRDSVVENLKRIEDVHKLLPLIQQLCGAALFITLKSAGTNCWTLRPRKVAKTVRTLGKEERMVYEVIEGAYEDGMWSRTIRNKTGIKDVNGIEKVLKKLQSIQLIKQIQQSRVGAQKTYMLYWLAPSDEITGGSFYDAGSLDESLVDELSNLILFHVRQASWGAADTKRKRPRRETTPIEIVDEDLPNGESRGRKKRKSSSGAAVKANDIEDLGEVRKQRSQKHVQDPETDPDLLQLTLPPKHAYPTATSIHNYIISSNILRGVKTSSLSVEEVQNVLNVMVWDEKLEEVNGGYRTIRGLTHQAPGGDDEEKQAADQESKRGNGLTEVPCGRCPVIDICGNGGPINAANCTYYEAWLRQSVAV
jgi:DNA-directed RNA polymerase III subunit RPC6